jgi:hypothetical protein
LCIPSRYRFDEDTGSDENTEHGRQLLEQEQVHNIKLVMIRIAVLSMAGSHPTTVVLVGVFSQHMVNSSHLCYFAWGVQQEALARGLQIGHGLGVWGDVEAAQAARTRGLLTGELDGGRAGSKCGGQYGSSE